MKLMAGVNFINILSAVFCQYFGAKNLQSQNVTREKLLNLLLYKKLERTMLNNNNNNNKFYSDPFNTITI